MKRTLLLLFVFSGSLYAQIPECVDTIIFSTAQGNEVSYLDIQANGSKMVFGMADGCWVSSGFGTLLTASNDAAWSKYYAIATPGYYFNCTSIKNAVFYNGAYYVVGFQSPTQVQKDDYWFGKIATNGDTLFNRVFGTTAYETGSSVKVSPTGLIIVSGYEEFGPRTGLFAYTVEGDAAWSKYYDQHFSQQINDFIITPDSGFVMTGSLSDSATQKKLWIAKANSAGTIIWEKAYAVAGNAAGNRVVAWNECYYIIGTYSLISGNSNTGGWVLKCGSNGDTVWTRFLPVTNYHSGNDIKLDSAGSVYALSSGSYGCPTTAPTSDFTLFKFADNGSLVWQWGMIGTGRCLTLVDNKNMIVGGSSIPQSIYSTASLFLIKLNYPPVFSTKPSDLKHEITEGSLYCDTVQAQDPDVNDTIAYSILAPAPQGLHIDSRNGIIQWVPSTGADSGNHIIHAVATDKKGQADTLTFTIHVTPVNDAPVIKSNTHTFPAFLDASIIKGSLYLSIPSSLHDKVLVSLVTIKGQLLFRNALQSPNPGCWRMPIDKLVKPGSSLLIVIVVSCGSKTIQKTQVLNR